MRPFEDELNGFVAEIWSSMLGLEARPDGDAIELTSRENVIVSRLSITGNWCGTVSIHCDGRLARDLAAIMFGSSAEATSRDMIEDALGELVNMTSGNFKSLLSERCYLSHPCASYVETPGLEDVVGNPSGHFVFLCLEGRFMVAIDEMK